MRTLVALLLLLAAPALAADSISVSVPLQTKNGSTIRVEVWVTGDKPFNASQVAPLFDPAQFTLVDGSFVSCTPTPTVFCAAKTFCPGFFSFGPFKPGPYSAEAGVPVLYAHSLMCSGGKVTPPGLLFSFRLKALKAGCSAVGVRAESGLYQAGWQVPARINAPTEVCVSP